MKHYVFDDFIHGREPEHNLDTHGESQGSNIGATNGSQFDPVRSDDRI